MDRDVTTMVSSDVAREISTKVQETTKPAPKTPLRGVVLVLIQYDVCEEIRLDALRRIFPMRNAEVALKKAPSYVRYQRAPVEETLEPLILDSGERLAGEIKYYDYGVVSLEFELPFSGDWENLVQLSCRWTSDINFEKLASRIVRQKLERAAPALIKPYQGEEWLQEDYFIFHVREIEGSPTADELLATQRDHIAQVVRGETATSPKENAPRSSIRACRTIPATSRSSDGMLPSSMTPRRAAKPRSSSCNTPTRSCSNSATTTNC